jgi:hypothetical protein
MRLKQLEYLIFPTLQCISREDLARWDVAWPLSVVSNNAGRRQTSLPLLICAGSDKNDHTKGDLLRLDRRTFALVERRRDEEETRSITASSGIMVGVGGGQQHQQQRQQRFGYCPSAMPSPESSPLIGGGATRFPNFGGS